MSLQIKMLQVYPGAIQGSSFYGVDQVVFRKNRQKKIILATEGFSVRSPNLGQINCKPKIILVK